MNNNKYDFEPLLEVRQIESASGLAPAFYPNLAGLIVAGLRLTDNEFIELLPANGYLH